MTLEYTYFRVVETARVPAGKTSSWSVVSKKGPELGIIAWYGPWRAYCFFPESDTVWSAGCLEELRNAIGVLNARHKEARCAP